MSIMGLVEVIKIPLWRQRASEFLKQGNPDEANSI